MNHIITYFYLEHKDNQSTYGLQEKDFKKKNEYYFRCIVIFFLSSKKYNSESKHYFVCNEDDQIEFIPNFNFLKFCNDNNIKIIKKLSKYVTKQKKWAGSMYLFDSIDYFNENSLSANDNYIFFDNDVLIHDSFKNIPEFEQNNELIGYDISNDYMKNGQWCVDFNGISKQYMVDHEFTPYGGEFLLIKGDFLEHFIKTFKNIYPIDEFLTEEHYISYMISKLFRNKYKVGKINNHLRRIWTTFKYNNVYESDRNLKILHLPSEKQFGLYWLNKTSINNCNIYNKELALAYTGITRRPLYIKVRLYITKIINKLSK